MQPKILFLYPLSAQSIYIETQLQLYTTNGFEVFLITYHNGDLNNNAKTKGIQTSLTPTHKIKIIKWIKTIIFLVKFCRKNKITHFISHLQQANLQATIIQYFIKSKVILFRHHGNYDTEKPTINELLADYIIHTFGKDIIVPSEQLMTYCTKNYLRKKNISYLPYLYDFNLYKKPVEEELNTLKSTYKASLILLLSARMVHQKQHRNVIETVYKMICNGYDILLLITDSGPLLNELKELVKKYKLEKNCIFLGFRSNLPSIMKFVDILVHPSLTEASNSTVKEMAILNKTVIIQKETGDFDSYIKNNINGFVLETNHEEELYTLLVSIYNSKEMLNSVGENLNKTVQERFGYSIKNQQKYLDLLV